MVSVSPSEFTLENTTRADPEPLSSSSSESEQFVFKIIFIKKDGLITSILRKKSQNENRS